MTVDDLKTLFAYSSWANASLRDVVSGLTTEQFTRQVAGSYGSIRNTMVHMLSAEWGWLERCGGWPRGEKLSPDRYPTPASLIDQWSKVEAKVREFLAATSERDLNGVTEFTIGDRTYRQERGQLLRHAAIHSVHHRGQVSLLIRALGKTPGNFDLLFYTEEAGASA